MLKTGRCKSVVAMLIYLQSKLLVPMKLLCWLAYRLNTSMLHILYAFVTYISTLVILTLKPLHV